ncbi:MAG: PTS sugar transporter subunit IIC [Armatimonadetes bacterium]|nr:PTS sugar transporter subunit IIC [Armatimonadota bacterium]
MEKILNFIEKVILPPISKLAELKHLRAIRDGIVAILPLIIVGSFFLLLGSLPVEIFSSGFLEKHQNFLKIINWYKNNLSHILMPYRLTMKLMALFASFTIAYNLAKNYKLDGISAGVLSMAAFLLTQIPQNIEKSWFLPLQNLGGQGLFASIIGAFFTVEVMRFCHLRQMSFKMPEGVPPSVISAFAALVPASIVFSIIWLLTDILHLNLVEIILKAFYPLIYLGDTLWAVILINLIMQLIWLGGIHGASVVNAVFLTIWMGYLEQNANALSAHQSLPYVTTLPFYQWFVWIGGSGATLSLAVLMLFSRSSYIKQIAKVSIIPGICNINEPIIFGLPLVMNPIMAIPFILTPIVCGIISYLALTYNLVNRFTMIVPWTLPAPIGAFLASGFDYRAIILVLINFIISLFIYFPFFKEYEKSLKE